MDRGRKERVVGVATEEGRIGWGADVGERRGRLFRGSVDGGTVGAYLLIWPSLMSRVFICERRSGSRVAGV